MKFQIYLKTKNIRFGSMQTARATFVSYATQVN